MTAQEWADRSNWASLGGAQFDVREWDDSMERIEIINATHKDEVEVAYIERGQRHAMPLNRAPSFWVSWAYLKSWVSNLAFLPCRVSAFSCSEAPIFL